MGLDIYLYKYENKSETDRLESEYETVSESNWKEVGCYDTATQEQKDAIREKNKQFGNSLGLDEWGMDKTNKVKIKIDSAIDKDHYFKIGYFRSSYNNGGINKILDNLGVPGLYEIFEPNDEYCFQPDWDKCLERCNESIWLLQSKANYRCFDVSPNIFGQPECKSEKEALEIFMKEVNRKESSFDAYSNNHGVFHIKEPLKVLGLIIGTESKLKKEIPCTYVITEGENEWYLTALKIVRETIEWVLAQSDINKYYLHWSR